MTTKKANVECENCGNDISSLASHCPKCGHPNYGKYCISIRQLLFIVTIAISILLLTVVMIETHLDNAQTDMYQQTAEDSVEQYNIVKQSGDHGKRCLHARIVTAAYIKAGDEAKHKYWKQIAQDECRQ